MMATQSQPNLLGLSNAHQLDLTMYVLHLIFQSRHSFNCLMGAPLCGAIHFGKGLRLFRTWPHHCPAVKSLVGGCHRPLGRPLAHHHKVMAQLELGMRLPCSPIGSVGGPKPPGTQHPGCVQPGSGKPPDGGEELKPLPTTCCAFTRTVSPRVSTSSVMYAGHAITSAGLPADGVHDKTDKDPGTGTSGGGGRGAYWTGSTRKKRGLWHESHWKCSRSSCLFR